MAPVRVWSRVLIVLVALSFLAEVTPVQARPAPIGQDAYVLDSSYRGDFPDPSILRVGSRWFAFATTTANLDLPVLVSRDLRHWTVTGPGGATIPDALPMAPEWAQTRIAGQRRLSEIWAPSVVRLPGGRFAAPSSIRGNAPRT